MAIKKDQIIDEKTMRKMSVAPPDPDTEKKTDGEMTTEEELEEGLKESFPASDPPAGTQPGHEK